MQHLPPPTPKSKGGRYGFHEKMLLGCTMVLTVVVTSTIVNIFHESSMAKKYRCDFSKESCLLRITDNSWSIPLKNSEEEDELAHSGTVLISEEDESLSIREYIMENFALGMEDEHLEALIRDLEFAYTNVREMLSRPLRFPSIDQRVRIYMSNWYIPPCDDDARVSYAYNKSPDDTWLTVTELLLPQNPSVRILDEHQVELLEQRKFIVRAKSRDGGSAIDSVYFLDRDVFLRCKNGYCLDTVEYILPSFDRVLHNQSDLNSPSDMIEASSIPILYQFGDMYKTLSRDMEEQLSWYPRMPVIQKTRDSMPPSLLKTVTDDSQYHCYKQGERLAPALISEISSSIHLEPIIMKLNSHRHYVKVYDVAEADVIPWERKKNQAVFRGFLTGRYPKRKIDANKLSAVEHCRLLERCWLTYSHASSALVDVKLVEVRGKDLSIPPTISPGPDDMKFIGNNATVDLFGETKSMRELLEYKALIMLEGNDISSGLKWALFSNSIVLMPEPLLTSWSMEEMLVPWVHYIPINVTKDGNGNAFTDTEEKMQWIIGNDDKAQEIAKAGKLWIADMILHPDVHNDEEEIVDEIARRYVTHFAFKPGMV